MAGDRPAVYRLDLAYDGTNFHGWARQPGVRTVEGELIVALEKLLRFGPKLSVAGRTDAGVHAIGQVASFVATEDLDVARVARALNGMLGPEVSVTRVRRAPDGFDARFSATARRYRYRLDTAVAPDPFTARFTWHRPGPLSVGWMRAAASELTGEHDFASFCRPPQPPGASTVRTLRRLTVASDGRILHVVAEANGFLHQMVRSLVGTLIAVGEGRMESNDMTAVLQARDRSAAGQVAPPYGLTLEHVTYGRGPTRTAGLPPPPA